jgi:hypothetical protein
MDLTLGNKEKSGGDKSEEFGEGFSSVIPCFAKHCDAAV